MGLRQKQSDFVRSLGKLIDYAYGRGYEFTIGDAYRDPRVVFPYSSPNSAHRQRLAVNLNLFVKGEWITSSTTPEYEDIGGYWESIGGIWGGRFNDGNHFEWPEK